MASSFCFVSFPTAVLFDENGKAVTQKLWGSFLLLTGEKKDGRLQVKFGTDPGSAHLNRGVNCFVDPWKGQSFLGRGLRKWS